MPESIPLFPLGTVLFPGMVLPLHIFEERYRELVRELVTQEDRVRELGVVAIRQGWEVGTDAVAALHEVGCAAELRQVTRHPDGKFDIVAAGTRRFRLLEVDPVSRPYLVGTVEWLADAADPAGEATLLVPGVGALFLKYVAAVATARGGRVNRPELPEDPGVLSFLVASAALLTMEDQQALLEQSSSRERLLAEARLLTRETTMLRTLRVVPAPLSELPAPTGLN
ncbi:MAG TPA: LON peptidase substrate-binding domain-containing protein [Mycobacteriales bacterium]|nr:LON peptidase substrate-binding domain-containing protein [Mycobacteriales bacterium]